jgi:hypothetical protein
MTRRKLLVALAATITGIAGLAAAKPKPKSEVAFQTVKTYYKELRIEAQVVKDAGQ